MTALHEAKSLYERHGLSFERDLCHYLEHGYVIAMPDRFIMAKPIEKDKGDDQWHAPNPDCWYVHLAAGKNCLKWFLDQAPVQLPYLAWRRYKQGANPLRVYNTATFSRLAP